MGMVLVLGLLSNSLFQGPIGLPLGMAQVVPWLLFARPSRAVPARPYGGMQLDLRLQQRMD
ncbi:MAG: hypothetical protein ACOCZK_01515 [Planctomycetota bacterium]